MGDVAIQDGARRCSSRFSPRKKRMRVALKIPLMAGTRRCFQRRRLRHSLVKLGVLEQIITTQAPDVPDNSQTVAHIVRRGGHISPSPSTL